MHYMIRVRTGSYNNEKALIGVVVIIIKTKKNLHIDNSFDANATGVFFSRLRHSDSLKKMLEKK